MNEFSGSTGSRSTGVRHIRNAHKMEYSDAAHNCHLRQSHVQGFRGLTKFPSHHRPASAVLCLLNLPPISHEFKQFVFIVLLWCKQKLLNEVSPGATSDMAYAPVCFLISANRSCSLFFCPSNVLDLFASRYSITQFPQR
ncbi:MAG: hypothetical protein U0694_10520 [Anaerolineae bacterium]